MSKRKKGLGPRGLKLQEWVEARKRHNLSHGHIQMARELGLKPSSLGKLSSGGSSWKVPLPVFIENLYEERFGKRAPDVVKPAEDALAAINRKKEEHRARKRAKQAEARSATAQEAPSAPEQLSFGSFGGVTLHQFHDR
jgi:transcriptional regulator with XRE-family HTH domain